MKPDPLNPRTNYCRHRALSAPRIQGIPYSLKSYRFGRGALQRRTVQACIYETDLILGRDDVDITYFVDVKSGKPLTAWLARKLVEL